MKEIRDKFLQFYNEFIGISLKDWKYVIKTLKKISKTEWDIINYMIETMWVEPNDDINLWKINVIQYSAILTLLQRHNQLNENPQTKKKPRWLEFQQQKVNSIRWKISYLNLIYQCRNHNTRLTKHREKIQWKLKKQYCNTKTSTLISKVTELKHELNVTSQYIKNIKNTSWEKFYQWKIKNQPEQVYHEEKNKKIEIKETPSAEVSKIFLVEHKTKT